MKTVTTSHCPPPLLALLMSQAPEQHPLPPLSVSSTPLSSIPTSPNPLQLSSLQHSAELPVSLAEALLHQFSSDHYYDDGVDLVMDVLNNEKAVPAPLPPPDVDRLLASWKAVDWGSARATDSNPLQPLHDDTPSSQNATTKSSVLEICEWRYSEDCILADILTRVQPELQREELRRRLPMRKWSDAQRRFQTVCDRVCSTAAQPNSNPGTAKERRRGFWRRRANTSLKPQCFISKTFSKFR